jgi:hypothetical protein
VPADTNEHGHVTAPPAPDLRDVSGPARARARAASGHGSGVELANEASHNGPHDPLTGLRRTPHRGNARRAAHLATPRPVQRGVSRQDAVQRSAATSQIRTAPSRAAVASQDSSGWPQQSITSPSTERNQASTGALAAHSAGVAFVTIGCLLAGGRDERNQLQCARQAATARRRCPPGSSALLRGSRPCPAQKAARAGLDVFAAVAADPDDNERCQEHPVGGEREPRRHHRVPVLGDDVAGVAIDRNGRGSADGGQSGSGEKAWPDPCPPLAHARRESLLLSVSSVCLGRRGERTTSPSPARSAPAGHARQSTDRVSPRHIVGRESRSVRSRGCGQLLQTRSPTTARPSLIGGDVHTGQPL